MTRSLDDITRETVIAFRRYSQEGLTDDLRHAAEGMVEAREYFFTREGRPDYAGRSFAYRAWAREAVVAAGVEPGEVQRVMAAARYHVSNVLRERLSADELASYGLRTSAARERSVEKREKDSSALRIAEGGDLLEDADDLDRAVHIIEHIARRVRPAGTPAQREEWEERVRRAAVDFGRNVHGQW